MSVDLREEDPMDGEDIDSNNVQISDRQIEQESGSDNVHMALGIPSSFHNNSNSLLSNNPENNLAGRSSQAEQSLQSVQQTVYQKSSLQVQSKPLRCLNHTCQSGRGMPIIKMTPGDAYQYLCQHCCKRYKEDHYCKYCKQIYFAQDDGDCWVQCDRCEKWTHALCEQKHGIYKNIRQLMQECSELPYKCPKCRPLKIRKTQQLMAGNPSQNTNLETKTVTFHQNGSAPTQPLKQKIRPKRVDVYLNNLGFFWRLKTEQIQFDLQRARNL